MSIETERFVTLEAEAIERYPKWNGRWEWVMGFDEVESLLSYSTQRVRMFGGDVDGMTMLGHPILVREGQPARLVPLRHWQVVARQLLDWVLKKEARIGRRFIIIHARLWKMTER